MLHIQRTKAKNLKSRAFFLVLFFTVSYTSFSQKVLYQEDHDNKAYYFGISLGISKASFHTHLNPVFMEQDSIMVAEPMNNGGFNLGLLATMNLTRRFELRFNPQLMFTERNIRYQLKYKDQDFGYQVDKKVESVITSFPLQVKFNSDRIGNFRVYMLGGGKVDYDLASNAQARKAEDLIKLQKTDLGVEAGLGFNFYFQSFIFSPEIKISSGLSNIHARDENLKYSSVLDRIQSRLIVFSIHIEG